MSAGGLATDRQSMKDPGMRAQQTVANGDRREVRITMRVDPTDKALIECAAKARSLSITDYMISIARADAEKTLVERCAFALDEEAFRRFNEILDRPAQDNQRLMAIFERNKQSKWVVKED